MNIKMSANKIPPLRGFTLIELLVVITILGILSVVGLGSFQSSQAKGRDAQRKQDLGQIQRALEMYYNDYKGYPATADFVGFGVTWEDVNETLYMKTVPNDPRGGDYCYESDGIYYKLYAKLENLQDSKRITPDSTVCTLANGYNYGVSSSNIAP